MKKLPSKNPIIIINVLSKIKAIIIDDDDTDVDSDTVRYCQV